MELVTPARPSIPGAGRTISAATEERASFVRLAVEIIVDGAKAGFGRVFQEVFCARWQVVPCNNDIETRAAWALVNILILARFAERADKFEAAEEWFTPPQLPRLNSFVTAKAKRAAEAALSSVEFDDDLAELLPYVLEQHGPGSRLSVMKDPSTRAARAAKRDDGVFYTPADVAEYIVDTVADPLSNNARFLDPACGTGVFLLALLRRSGEGLDYATRHLFGIDLNVLAVESCSFALLRACQGTYSVRPWAAWHLLRMNLAAHDALSLQNQPLAIQSSARENLRQALLADECPEPTSSPANSVSTTGHRSIWQFFPECQPGFDSVIGNPPYAQIGRRKDVSDIEKYAAMPFFSATANMYPLFIEMMWRFAKRTTSHSGMVVPLSIAFHQGQHFTACRTAMSSAGGSWRCAFFDREPHALFGEDVKTRNAILFHSDGGAKGTELAVSPLLKWTSRTRAKLFASIKFTSLGSIPFGDGIPKLGSDDEAKAFAKLAIRKQTLESLCVRSFGAVQSDATKAALLPRVFVASTAYNFLNVFRSLSGINRGVPVSENKVHGFEFATEDDANLAFAIFSSRLTFWLWHTKGDGFHVGGRFLKRLPFNSDSFDDGARQSLERLGRELWASLQEHRIVSVNRGRQTVAYRPLPCRERDEIDRVLVRAAKLPVAFADTLRSFVEKVVVVDDDDTRRVHLKTFFQPETIS